MKILISDEELIRAARGIGRSGVSSTYAQEELIRRYKKLVKIKASAYFLPGGDWEDIIQEGMIGLFKAIRDYSSNYDVQFNSFAALCINRQIISAIKASTRLKHIPLNASLAFDFVDTEDEDTSPNPETLFIDREEKTDIEQHIRKALSPLEEKVLALHMNGRSYAEIAQLLNKNVKAIDNTIQRVRRKVGKIMEERKAGGY
ncbi:MAG: sigma-70 family RNA polymerase sigma factor [Defluviitaleaceae bacterium]|nr:sigma-70 family RNA polymerase sigma factor [Defluviitaleaceae bacterium]